MLRAQQIARTDSTEGGYAMMFISIVTVMMFSLLAAYLTVTNITRSATNAYTEGNSTFYAAESGLNRRSDEVRQKFINYATPDGVSPGTVAGQIAGPENMAACLDANLANDGSGDFVCQKLDLNYRQSTGSSVSKDAGGASLASDYNNIIKYSAYTFASDRTNYIDPVRRIPQVQPIPAGQAYAGLNAQEYRYTIYSMATSKQPGDLDARAMTVLEMTFKSRTIPLFQFAAFYNGDLEMNSTSQMNINGRVHTNANLYIQPTPYGSETTKLLSQVTAANSIYNRVDASTINRIGTTQVLLTGNPNNPGDPSNVYEPFPATDLGGRFNPLTPGEITAFQRKVLDGTAGAAPLQVPQPGFLRKRDPDGEIGEYYGKADLRLEMVPKRAAGNVPFNFAAIKTAGTGGSCSGFDISTGRQGTINCTQLNEGQLRSLSQPVMVKVVSNEERTRFCPSVTVNHNPGSHNERKILRALQVAIAAQNTPVSLTQLNSALSDSANASISSIATSLKSLDTSRTPAALAGEVGACFLPAPIQVVTKTANNTTNNDVPSSDYNWTSGHFDRREGRWIGMLQTNIGSLTVWNRDGLYVDRDNNLNSIDATTPAQQNLAFNNGNNGSAYDTNNLLFFRSAPKPTAPTGSFQKLGLGSNDTSEGGLVFHTTVSDDLDGDGTADITVDPGDNLRNYPDGKKKSSYGFTFGGGEDLPAPLTIVTDRALYVQGDYNSFLSNAGKQPAALIGDTITVLSKSCLDDTNSPPTSGYRMVNCGVKTTVTKDASETTVNAAFLSYTDSSNGNSTGSSPTPTPKKYSGGLNNYMRMVENWGGKAFNYTGSFVSLGTPQEYSGEYLAGSVTNEVFVPGPGGSYYNVPIRNFNYDTDFNAFDRLPPLTPKVIYLQQETFKRSYK
jgi:hypothetical protein